MVVFLNGMGLPLYDPMMIIGFHSTNVFTPNIGDSL